MCGTFGRWVRSADAGSDAACHCARTTVTMLRGCVMRCGARLTCLALLLRMYSVRWTGAGERRGVEPGPEHGLIVICRYHESGGSGTDNDYGN